MDRNPASDKLSCILDRAPFQRGLLIFVAGLLMTVSLSGCSLGVMIGRVIFGDPLIVCEFQQYTGIKLPKSEKRVLILCTAPHTVRSNVSSIDVELLDGVARRLKVKKVDVVDPDRVATWLDDHGGMVDEEEFPELAKEMKANYIIHIELDEFDYKEENSPNLLRGRTTANLFAYEVHKLSTQQDAENQQAKSESENDLSHYQVQQIFTKEFVSVYPISHPKSLDQMSEKTFLKQYVDVLSLQLARVFHSYRNSDYYIPD